MFGSPYDQLREMEDLGYNAEGKNRFRDTKPNHKLFRVAKKVDWEVLEVCTGHNWVKDLPLLVYEQVLLGVIYTMYSKSHVNGIHGFHNECTIHTNLL